LLKFVLNEVNSWENEIVPSCSEPHGMGIKSPGFDRVEVVKAVLLSTAAQK